MRYAYPAILTICEDHIEVDVPDLGGIHTFGTDYSDALFMAQDAIEMWLWDAENKNETIPQASTLNAVWQQIDQQSQSVSLIPADTDEYRMQAETRAVKKTLSIPAWLNYKAEKANAPFSQILQQGLKEYLGV